MAKFNQIQDVNSISEEESIAQKRERTINSLIRELEIHTSLLDNKTENIKKSSFLVTTTLIKKKRNKENYLNNYRIIKVLGQGECGKVKLAYDEVQKRYVAIKQVYRADTSKRRVGGPTQAQQLYLAFLREVKIMKNLRHSNIASVYEIIDDPNADKVYLVMQYIENGPIAHIEVRSDSDEVCEPIPPVELARAARQIFAGLEYLHRHGIVHRDLKPDNILMSRDKHVYLVDFGVAEAIDTTYRARIERKMAHSMAQSIAMSEAGEHACGPLVVGAKGTLLFIAPEVWTEKKIYGKAVDMWAVGVTLYILLTGKLPFHNLSEVNDPLLPVIPTCYGNGWSQLLRGLLERNAEKRLTYCQVCWIFDIIEEQYNQTEERILDYANNKHNAYLQETREVEQYHDIHNFNKYLNCNMKENIARDISCSSHNQNGVKEVEASYFLEEVNNKEDILDEVCACTSSSTMTCTTFSSSHEFWSQSSIMNKPITEHLDTNHNLTPEAKFAQSVVNNSNGIVTIESQNEQTDPIAEYLQYKRCALFASPIGLPLLPLMPSQRHGANLERNYNLNVFSEGVGSVIKENNNDVKYINLIRNVRSLPSNRRHTIPTKPLQTSINNTIALRQSDGMVATTNNLFNMQRTKARSGQAKVTIIDQYCRDKK